MHPRHRIIVVTAVAAVAVVVFGAGAWALKVSMDNSLRIPGVPAAAPIETSTTTPTPTDVSIGGILDEETALELRREMPDSGDFAYKLPDGRWVKVNRNQPLPAEAMAAEQIKADALPLPTDGSVDEVKKVRQGALSARGAYTFGTGRNAFLVYQGLQGTRSGNVTMWQLDAPNSVLNQLGKGENGWPSAEQAVARAQQLIATLPDAVNWDIIVANQH